MYIFHNEFEAFLASCSYFSWRCFLYAVWFAQRFAAWVFSGLSLFGSPTKRKKNINFQQIAKFCQNHNWGFDFFTVLKNEKFSLTEEIFRQINSLVTYLEKQLLSRIFAKNAWERIPVIFTLWTKSMNIFKYVFFTENSRFSTVL